jgi:hypothetical protein
MASKPVTMAEANQVISLYLKDTSAFDIAGMMGRSKDTVLAVLRANHVPIRPRGRPSNDSGEHCPAFARMEEDARFGSQQLLAAIERAGLRP